MYFYSTKLFSESVRWTYLHQKPCNGGVCSHLKEKKRTTFLSSCSYSAYARCIWTHWPRSAKHAGLPVQHALPNVFSSLETIFTHNKPSTRGNSANTIILFISTFLASRFFSSISSSSPIFLVLSSISSITAFTPLPDLLSPPPSFFLWQTSSSENKWRSFIGWGLCKVCWRGGKEMKRTLPTRKVCILHVKGCMRLCGSICVQFPVSLSSICPFSLDIQTLH